MTHVVNTSMVDRYPSCILTSPKLTTALLKAGADPTATDNSGNTALHLIAMSYPWRTDLATILLNSGAHLDAINNNGQTYESLLEDKQRFDSLNPLKYTSLKCLAARIINRANEIDIVSVPKHLREFVLKH